MRSAKIACTRRPGRSRMRSRRAVGCQTCRRDGYAVLKVSPRAADEVPRMAFDLDHALRYLIAAEGSDLHLKVPSYPLIRLHGHLEPIAGTERLFPEDTR